MAGPPAFDRAAMLERLAAESFDILVIGGGITGCGIALDAASRGLRVALVERHDFASGTSSKSSKLVHGGLRYLSHGHVRLVYEALRERQRLLRNAAHLVSVQPFLIPVLTRDGPVSRKIAKAVRSALWAYDLTGGARIGKRHKRLDADATLAVCPTLPAERVSSGFIYYDARTDDARLTLAVARTAALHGAVVVNHCEVVALRHDPCGRLSGADVRAEADADGDTIAVRAAVVVSAAGVWADRVRQLGTPGAPIIRPAKGVHITIPWSLVRATMALIITVPGDKRSLFVVPWIERRDGTFEYCYVGTTDTDFDGDLDDPPTTDADIDYLLAALNHSLTTTVSRADVTAVWAGLRPLVRTARTERTADLSRRHAIDQGPDGLITVVGGKLTTYRQMAEETVDAALAQLDRRAGRCPTRRLRLIGSGDTPRIASDDDADIDPGLASHLVRRFGSEAAHVTALAGADPGLAEPLVPGLPYRRAEALFAVRHEMASTLSDVLMRRTRAHLLDRAATRRAAPQVADLLAGELGWDARQRARQLSTFTAASDAELNLHAAPQP